MRTGKTLGVLPILAVLTLVSVQCNKAGDPAPSGQPSSKPSTVAEGSNRPEPPLPPIPTRAETPLPPAPPIPTRAEIPPPAPPDFLDQSRRVREQGAMTAIADIRLLLANRDYDGARHLAAAAARDYADTSLAAEFPPLVRQAEEGAAAARDIAQAANATEAARAERHGRFLQARDAGIAAMNRQDYPGAVAWFQRAIREEEDPGVRELLRQATNLQVADAQKRAYLERAYADLVATGDAAAAAGRWEEALDAYRRASLIRNSPEILDRMTDTARRAEDFRRARRDYEAAMTAADAAFRSGDWDKSLDFYRKALSIIGTPEASAGLENARGRLIEAARDRKRLYDAAMADGAARLRSGDWVRALDACQQAVEIDPTDEAKAALALARRKIAEQQQAAKKAYADAMAEAKAAVQAGAWQKAHDAFTRAAAIDNTPEAAGGVAAARRKLSEIQANTKLYDAAMADAKAAALSGDWQKALNAYQQAAAIDGTSAAKAGADLARRKLADAAAAADKKKEYAKLVADGGAAAKARDWQKALDAFTKAAAIDNTPEAQADIANAKKRLSDKASLKSYDRITYDVTGGIAGLQQKAVYAADGKFQVRDGRPPRTADGQITEAEMADLGSRAAAVDWKSVKPSYVNPQVADSMSRRVTVVIGQATYMTVVGDAPKEKPPAPVVALLDYLGELGRRHSK